MKDKRYLRCFGRKFIFKRLWPAGALFLAAAFFGTSVIYAAQEGSVADNSGSVQAVNIQRKNFTLQKKDNLITLNAQDADVAEVLKEIENVSGVKMTIDQRLIGKKVSTRVENKDVEGALREVLRDQYYVLTYEQDPNKRDKRIVKEVKAGGPEVGSKNLRGKVKTFNISYGNGNDQVGITSEKAVDEERRGPESFSVDNRGNIYICDTVNRRIQVFSPAGAYLYQIPLKEGMEAKDIAIDRFGHIYVYDGNLHQFDGKRNFVKSLKVEDRWEVDMGIHIVNDNIYMQGLYHRELKDVVIGRIVNGELMEPTVEDISKIEKGVHGLATGGLKQI